jgi:hypothetical protein
MSYVEITCQCGHTANANRFTQGIRRTGRKNDPIELYELPNNEWRCSSCWTVWRVTLQGIEILSQPVHTKPNSPKRDVPAVAEANVGT